MCANCKIFNALDNEAFRPLKIFAFAAERLDRPRRNAAVELIRFGESLIQKGFCSENAKIRQRAATKQNTIRPNKTIVTNTHRPGRLAILFNIDAVADNLGMKSGERRETADRHRVRAVDEVPIRNRGMLAKYQFGPPICLMRKVRRRTGREPGNPITTPDRCVRFEVKKLDVFANRGRADAASLFHD